MLASLQQGKSICVTGDVGMGKTHLAKLVQDELDCCYGIYRGDNTKCLQMIAEGLDIDLYQIIDEGDRGKPLTAKQLREEITLNLSSTILICDRIHKWPASLKGWLEDLHESGAVLLLLGNQRDLEGVLFKVPRLTLPPLDEQQIRTIIWSEASKMGVQISPPKAAELASRAGGNPLLAQRMVLELQQGVESNNNQDSNNYRDITPFLMAIAGLLGAVRFIGMATGDLHLRILGGLAITVLFSLRSLSLVFPKRNSRR
ncbi:AAA family ATPase [Nostoc cycadae]|uniref:Small G protein, GTPase SAR1 n=1 Tax=Nostoc cycadae WK-1 TaxID=1861711 RepID=A0A2H6LR15_9NOSO|nr:AAA family ATPase [Nostoc cycadae]GBE95661.1 small G protein, GTPase SAR1 [Nostoc cycadae WK-1]